MYKRIIAMAVAALVMFTVAAMLMRNREAESTEDVLRLHIVANSDSAEDQRAKLLVRDAVLELMDGAADASSAEEAEAMMLSMGSELIAVAEAVLTENGLEYGAQLVSGEFSFPERQYGERVYPEGEYKALRIILGDGAGENWWCVLFPPLCITKTDTDEPVEFKSFFAELWERIVDIFN